MTLHRDELACPGPATRDPDSWAQCDDCEFGFNYNVAMEEDCFFWGFFGRTYTYMCHDIEKRV